jgi:hypothetical protein
VFPTEAIEGINQFVTSFTLNMATDMAAPSFFDVFVTVRSAEPTSNGTLRVFMRNWTTGNLDLQGTLSVSNSLQTFQILGIPAANYRRPADGAIQLFFYTFNNGTVSFDPYVHFFDKVKVVPR